MDIDFKPRHSQGLLYFLTQEGDEIIVPWRDISGYSIGTPDSVANRFVATIHMRDKREHIVFARPREMIKIFMEAGEYNRRTDAQP